MSKQREMTQEGRRGKIEQDEVREVSQWMGEGELSKRTF
jgi:hypothetical protein